MAGVAGLRPAPTEGENEVEVTWEDQQNINSFGRLVQRFHEIEDEISANQEEITNIEDASNELVLVDDDEPVKYMIGELYVDLTKDEADARLTATLEEKQAEAETLKANLAKIKGKMDELKVKLYGRFGKAINLEESD